MRRYNVFWLGYEPNESTPPPQSLAPAPVAGGGVGSSLVAPLPPCPSGLVRVPTNESDRTARGYHNYHCYALGKLSSSLDVAVQLDASIGSASSFILYGSPAWARHPNCTGFPWGTAPNFKLGCYPWDHLTDWEDFVNMLVERYGTF